jgi:alpha-tubulin suppressor-like RCC1 family protein
MNARTQHPVKTASRRGIASICAAILAVLAPSLVEAGTVATGWYHSVVRSSDSTVWTWGANANAQLGDGTTTTRAVPTQVPGLTEVTAVCAGAYHTVVLKSDGTVWGFGYNAQGQLGDGTTTQRSTPVQATGLSGISAIACGENHTLAWTAAGAVYAWGANSNGQIGDSTTTNRTAPVQVTGLSGVAAIGAGSTHSLAVKADGTAWAWGSNSNSELGDGTTTQRTTPVQVLGGLSGVASATGGYHASVFLKSDGSLRGVGYNGYSQIGDGTTTQRSTPVAVSGLTGMTTLGLGYGQAHAIKSDATLWGWGRNSYGGVGDATVTQRNAPVQIAGAPSGISEIARGFGDHTVAVTADGQVWAWGRNGNAQVGDGTVQQRNSPVQIAAAGYAWLVGTPTMSPVTGTYTSNQNITLTSSTAGATIRYTTDGSDPSASSTEYSAPVSITQTTTLKARAWKAGSPVSGLAAETYTLQAVAPGASPGSGTYTAPTTVTLSTSTSGASIRYTTDGSTPTESSALYSTPLSIGTTTTLKAAAFKAGWNGSATTTATYTMNFGVLQAPTFGVAAGTYVESASVSMTALAGATIRYTTNGADPTSGSTVYSGPVYLAQTTTLKAKAFHPDYTTSATTTAVYTIKVATPTFNPGAGTYAPGSAISIADSTAGASIYWSTSGVDPTTSDASITSGGSVLLGNFTLKARAFKAGCDSSDVASASYLATGALTQGQISAGAQHSFALRPDGLSWGWGVNYGRLGFSGPSGQVLPAQPLGLTGVTQVASGADFTLMLKADGTLWAFGANAQGQLGDGTTTARTTPVQVVGLTGVVAIAAGINHSLAVKADGSVWSWGYNYYSQLGDGTTTTRTSPVQVSGLTGAVSVAVGVFHSLALKADGTVHAWGHNAEAQLGDGTTIQRSTPVPVGGGLSGVVRIAAGARRSYALKADGSLLGWGSASYGLGDGTTYRSTPGLIVTGATRVAIGDEHMLVVMTDGSVLAWGANSAGQLGDATTTNRSLPSAVPGLAGVAEVSAGTGFSLALATDATIWSWGMNGGGQLGDGTTVQRLAPVKVSEADYAWKTGTPTFSPLPGQYSASQNITLASATAGASIRYTVDGSEPTIGSTLYTAPVAVQSTGTLRARAFSASQPDSNSDQATYTLKLGSPTVSLGDGTYSADQTATLTCSSCTSMRYTLDGSTPDGTSTIYVSPITVDRTLTLKARAFRAGWTDSDVTTRTYTMKVATPGLAPPGGTYSTAQTVTVTDTTPGATLHYTTDGEDPVENDPVVAGGTVAVGQSGTLKVKGWRSGWTSSDIRSAAYFLNLGPVATPTFSPGGGTYASAQTVALATTTPEAIIRYTLDGASPSPLSPIYAGPIAVPATTTIKAQAFHSDRAPSALGSATYTITTSGAAMPTLSVPSGRFTTTRTVTVSCSTAGATIHYTTDGAEPTAADPSIASGSSMTVDRSMIVKARAFHPTLAASATARRDYVVTGAVAAGEYHTLVLKADQTVWSFGRNNSAQLGDGTTITRNAPTQVPGLAGVVAIAAGTSHSLALLQDGTLRAWGANSAGQLCDGSTTQRASPVQVTGLSGVVAIAAGQLHTLALKSDGTVVACGSNTWGQLGTGATPAQTSTPVTVSGLTNVVAIAAGYAHSLALKADGTVLAFGYNTFGQLGDGTSSTRTAPVVVPALAGITAIASHNMSSYLLRTDGLATGAIWAFGGNGQAELGDGSTTMRNTPVATALAAPVASVAAGYHHALAVALDGTILTWGSGLYGQLGAGGGQNLSLVPGPTGRLDEVLVLEAGAAHSLGVATDGHVLAFGANSEGQLGMGVSGASYFVPTLIPNLLLVDNSWLASDTDHDGLSNAAEYRIGTDPLNPDSNGNGIPDGQEFRINGRPYDPDPDGDGLANQQELQLGTNPDIWDTDGDGVGDGVDPFPLDPTRSQAVADPNDIMPPTISLQEPANATPLP